MVDPKPVYLDQTLPLETRVQDLVSRLSLQEKIALMPQYQAAVPRLGLAAYKHGTEAAHGVSWLGAATSFPQVSGLASTWDTELLKKIGDVISTEARAFFKRDPAKNGLTLWTPTVDLGRDPRWGRNEECWGEDPHLAGTAAGAFIGGLQGSDPRWLKSCATLKHFIANNSEFDRGTASISLDPRNLREYYLRSFELCIKHAGAQSMMTSYNSVNGIPANLNPDLEEIVRQEWGFNGFVVSDAGDVAGTKREHGWTKTWSESVAESVKAGIDSITDDTAWVIQALQDALARGELAESDLDRAVGNSLRVRFKLGEFDPDCSWNAIGPEAVDLPEHRALSRKAAEASFVLLENRPLAGGPLLPLDTQDHQTPGSLAILGPLADLVLRDWYSGTLPYAISPKDGLEQRFPGGAVVHASGNPRLRFAEASTGKPVRAGGWDGVLEAFDWGQGNHTFKRTDAGTWLGSEDRLITSTSSEIFGWFTKEVFALEGDLSKGEVSLASWNGEPLVLDDNGALTLGSGLSESQGPIGIAALKKAESGGKSAARLRVLPDGNGLEEAVALARKAHTAVVCIGNHPLVNAKETIDRPHLDLAKSQEDLVRAVLAVNQRTVVLIFGSYPLSSSWIAANVPAIVHAAHPGQETGNALAAILSGDRNPSGRLPTTWYQSHKDLPDLLDYDIIRGKRTYQYFPGPVLWPFGHGKSYTTFQWSDPVCGKPAPDGSRTLGLTVRNTGSRAGADLVQIYVQAQNSGYSRPLRQLAAFERVELLPGESRRVELSLEARSFELWHPGLERWFREEGDWLIMAARSALDPVLELKVHLDGEEAWKRNLGTSVKAKSFDSAHRAVLDYNGEAPSCGSVRPRRPDEYAGPVKETESCELYFQNNDSSLEYRGISARLRGSGKIVFWSVEGGKEVLLASRELQSGGKQDTWRTIQLGCQKADCRAVKVELVGPLVLSRFQFYV